MPLYILLLGFVPMEACPLCDHVADLRNLVSHLKSKHGYNKDQIGDFRQNRRNDKLIGSVNYKCLECLKIFGSDSGLRRHIKEQHKKEGISYMRKDENGVETVIGGYECVCGEVFTKLAFLEEHKRSDHPEFTPTVVSMSFENKASFEEWFGCLQNTTGSRFFIRTSYGAQTRHVFYCCQHVGHYKETATMRFPKVTRKTEETCSSFARIQIHPDMKVSAQCCFEHSHVVNHAVLKLGKVDLEWIVTQMREGKKDIEICNLARKTKTKTDRLFFLTMSDLRNVRERFGLVIGRRHADDLKSIELAAEEDPSVRRFSPPIESSGEGFRLTFVTEKQAGWIKEYGDRGVQFDDTFHITAYRLRLTTMLVMDHNDRIRPAAFFLSNSLSTEDLVEFMNEIKKVAPRFKPRYIMTDEAEAFYKAFSQVWPEQKSTCQRLLCHFHVLQSWSRKAIKLIKNESERVKILQFLQYALLSTEKDDCQRNILKFLSVADNSKEGQEFARYYLLYYDSRKHLWASSERHFSPFNTTSGAESWHAVLKGSCLQRHQNIRMDFLLSVLSDAIEWIDHKRLVEQSRCLSSSNTRKAATNRFHLEYEQLSRTDGEEHNLRTVDIDSFIITFGGKEFQIMRSVCTCDPDVNSHCSRCSVCPYALRCSCRPRPGVCCVHMHYWKMSHLDLNSGEDFDNYGSSILADSTDEWEQSLENLAQPTSVTSPETMPQEVVQSSSSESDSELSINEGLTSDGKKEQLEKLKRAMDSVYSVVQSLTQTDHNDEQIVQIVSTMEEFSIQVKQQNPLHVSSLLKRMSVSADTSIRDDTMRQRFGMTKRKKTPVAKDRPEKTYLQSDDITFCGICKKKYPESDESVICWLACSSCLIWVHETCASQSEGICDLCNSKYEEKESLE